MRLRIGNKVLLNLGIILLVIGLVVYFFYSDPLGWGTLKTYPFLILGIVLALAGIILLTLRLLYTQRRLPPPTSQTPPH